MKSPTVVIGAGIVGILTAYHLVRKGEYVVVVDAAEGPALECSRGNAGIVALGHAESWGSPSALLDMIKAVFGLNPALKLSRVFDVNLWKWGLEFMLHCTPAAHSSNSQSLLKLSEYSRDIMSEIEAREDIDHHRSERGAFYLYQSARQYERRLSVLKRSANETGKRHVQAMTPQELVNHDPALKNLQTLLTGGLFSPRDISGDCAAYTSAMAEQLKSSGLAEFRYGHRIESVVHDGKHITALNSYGGPLPVGKLVIAAGCGSRAILAPLGIRPSIYPVKGYSATYKILNGRGVPDLPAVDETELLAFARYGDRFRITATAELDGYNTDINSDRLEILNNYARKLCGRSLDYHSVEYWCGLRPSTPSSRPYLGKISRFNNLWINAGHGQLGWTMAAGCGKALADLMTGNTQAVNDVSAKASWLDAI